MRRTLIALTTAAALTLGAVPAASAAELPAEMRLGSSGAQMLSSGDTGEGAMLLGRDWLIGFVGVAVLGSLIQAVSAAVR